MASLGDIDLCEDCTSRHLNDFLSMDTSADVNLPFASSTDPPLHAFIKHGHVKAVKLLKENYKNLDINKPDCCGLSPLHLALDNGEVEIVTFLLNAGCDVDLVTNKSAKLNDFDLLDAGASALHMAIQVKHNIEAECLQWDAVTGKDYLELIEKLCDQNANCNLKTSRGRTAAHYAIMYGDQGDVIETLAKYKADFEISDNKQQTPLLCAVAYSKLNCVKALVENGANVHATVGDQTALHIIFDKELDRMINYDLVKLLLNAGCPVNACDGFGDTALHIAISNENLSAVNFLLANGADCLVRYEAQPTHLQEVMQSEYPEMATRLMERLGGNLQDVPESENYTPFHQVMFMNTEEKAKEFCGPCFAAGVSVDIQTAHGKTPLMLAVAQQRINLARFLIQHGADINLQDSKGWNVLHIASHKLEETHLNIEFYEELLSYMRDINAVTGQNSSSLHIACNKMKPALITTLLKAGVSLFMQDHDFDKPIEIAIGKKEILSCVLLLSAGAFIDSETSEIFETDLLDIEEKLLLKQHKDALYVFLSSGYKFHIESLLDKVDLAGDTCLENAEMILKSAQGPLPLKRKSANVILRSLCPNGWVGVNELPFPPGVKDLLQLYIVMK